MQSTNFKPEHSMTYKILVVNLANPLSHGGVAITISLLKNLKVAVPEAKISLMATRDFDVSIYTQNYGFSPESFVKHTWFRSRKSTFSTLVASMGPAARVCFSCVWFNFLSKIGVKGKKSVYHDYDVVLDLSSDSLNEYYGIVYPLFSLFQLNLLLLSNKKVIVCPASIGPFKNPLLKRLVNHILSKTDLVIAREETTLNFLKETGVPDIKIHSAADLAFLFEPASKERAIEIVTALGVQSDNHPLIGVAPSSEIFRYCFPEISDPKSKYTEYVRLMAKTTDFIIEKFDANVVFIPHFVFPNEFIKNDKIASQDIFNQLKNKERVKILLADYPAEEVKSVIALCDMLVSCRMHAAIAATSSAVPTVVLAFGHKFHSVLGNMLGQDQCIVKTNANYQTVLTDLEQTITDTWNNRSAIYEVLTLKYITIKEKALSSFTKIKELL